MELLFKLILVFALGSVAIVLFLGLKNLATGGSANTSQKLMRLRVLFQAIAVVILLVGLAILGH